MCARFLGHDDDVLNDHVDEHYDVGKCTVRATGTNDNPFDRIVRHA